MSKTTSTLADVEADLDAFLDANVRKAESFGFCYDLRLQTRTSMPALWPDNYDARQQAPPLTDCNTLLNRAARYRAQRRWQDYERCMRALLAFFVDKNAAPARSPAQVAAAFNLTSQSTPNAVDAPYLDADATWRACCAPIDVDSIDATKESAI